MGGERGGKGREQREHRVGEQKGTHRGSGTEERLAKGREGWWWWEKVVGLRQWNAGTWHPQTQLSCRLTGKGAQVPAHLGREVLYVHHEPAQEEPVGRRELSQRVLECTHLLLPLWVTS